MVQINFARKEVNCKIVFYGPGMSGKTTNLEKIFENAPDGHKGDLTSIATEGDRTLFFDFLPLDLGTVAGMNTKFQLYTVPGQVYYNSTRKLVLQGADGVIFVADSQKKKMDENIESLENLTENLKEYNLKIDEIPLVLQWNKRDMPDALPVEELEAKLNKWGVPTFPAVAITGEGVFPTLKALSAMVLENLNKEYGVTSSTPAPAKPKAEQKPAPRPEPRPAEADKPAPAPQPQAAARPLTPGRPQPAAAPAPKPAAAAVAQKPAPAPAQRPAAAPAPRPAERPTPARPASAPTPARPKPAMQRPSPSKGVAKPSKQIVIPSKKTNPLIYVIVLVLILVVGAVLLVVLNPLGGQQ